MDFDGFETCCFSACFTGVISNEVSPSCDPCSVWFIFFWAYGADYASIGDGAAFGDL